MVVPHLQQRMLDFIPSVCLAAERQKPAAEQTCDSSGKRQVKRNGTEPWHNEINFERELLSFISARRRICRKHKRCLPSKVASEI